VGSGLTGVAGEKYYFWWVSENAKLEPLVEHGSNSPATSQFNAISRGFMRVSDI